MENTQNDTNTNQQVMRCYIYASAAQSRPGVIDQQIRESRALAETLSTTDVGYQVVQVFQDEGRSKFSGHRPGYEEMLAGLERGDAEVVLVSSEDRLYRNPTIQQSYRDLTGRLTVATYSVQAGRIDR